STPPPPSFPTRRSSDLSFPRTPRPRLPKAPSPRKNSFSPSGLSSVNSPCPPCPNYRAATCSRAFFPEPPWLLSHPSPGRRKILRSEEHTSELQSLAYLV